MNLCDKIEVRLIETGVLVIAKDRSTYDPKEYHFPNLGKAFEWIRKYWSYDVAELSKWNNWEKELEVEE